MPERNIMLIIIKNINFSWILIISIMSYNISAIKYLS